MSFVSHCALSALVAMAVTASPVYAAEYPERNITVIVPFPPGGASDMTARLVAAKFAERVKQSVVIDNRAGANGALGAGALKQAAADGYTLLIGSIGVFAINPALFKDLRYDPQKDFDLLSVAVRTPNVLVANPGYPANSVRELIEQLNKNPGKVTFALVGYRFIGSFDRCAVLAENRHDRHPCSVSGRRPGHQRFDRRPCQRVVPEFGAIAEQVKSGKLKALAVTSDKRVAALPNVPTMAEAGVKDLEVYSWQAAAAPKGLPAAVRAKLEAELAAAAQSPDTKAKFEAVGFDVVANNGKQFEAFLADELARWKTVIETGKISPE